MISALFKEAECNNALIESSFSLRWPSHGVPTIPALTIWLIYHTKLASISENFRLFVFFHTSLWLNLLQGLLLQFSAVIEFCSVYHSNYLVWFSYQIWQKERAMDCQDCWEDYWCSTAHPPRPVHLQTEETGRRNHFTHTHAAASLNSCYRALEHPAMSFSPQAIYLMNN